MTINKGVIYPLLVEKKTPFDNLCFRGMQNDPSLGGNLPFRQAVERGVHGGDGDFALFVAGLAGGEALHLQSGPAQGFGHRVFGVRHGFEHFIADASHTGQQDNPAQHPQQVMGAQVKARQLQYQHVDNGIENDAQEEGEQQEAGAAAGMQGGELLGVLGGQG